MNFYKNAFPLFTALIMAVPLIASCDPAPGNDQKPPLDLMISAGDSWWFGSWLPVDSAGSIRDSVRMWADVLNIKRVYWRGQQEEMMMDYGLVRPDNLQYHEFFTVWERYLMKELGLNQVVVTEAHQRKMEVYFLAPLFDFGGPADNGGCKEYPYYGQINFTLQHPEWMPVDRYGIRQQNGPIELCYPEARKAIDMYLHYLDRDNLDGITFFTYCENYGLRFEDEFGFNQPIVDEYQRRYGVDIRTEPFDKHLWRYLRGEYVTQFLRELKSALQTRGKKLGVMLNPREPNFTEPWNVPQYLLTSGRVYLDWERWVRESLVDELVIGGNAPFELRQRTLENVVAESRGTKVVFSTLTSKPYSDQFKSYVEQGMRAMIFATDEASYLKLVYPEQTAEALSGKDIYAAMRFLGQVAEGKAVVSIDQILPFTKNENVLVRRLALQALGRLKDSRGIAVLEDALDDSERSVRAAAAFALVNLHGPRSVAKLIATVRKVREFQIFEAVSSTLSTIDSQYLPEILAIANDQDVLLRRMALYVLGRRGDVKGLPTLLAGLEDQDLFVRFRAAHGLQVFGKDSKAVDALLKALNDPSPVIQDRTAISLAIGLVEGSTTAPRLGLESSIRILKTESGPLPDIRLNATQRRVLEALTKKFKEFGDGSARTDEEWGFRAVGNSILAFGSQGGKRLQQMIDQKSDKQLALLAWQVLNIRQGMENFCLIPGLEELNARIYSTHPDQNLIKRSVRSGGPKYDPTQK